VPSKGWEWPPTIWGEAATRWIEEGVIWYGGCGMQNEKNLVARTSGTSLKNHHLCGPC